MKILVDSDACPVTQIILEITQEKKLETHLFFDTTHHLESDYAILHCCDKGRDSVDLELLKYVLPGDLVITQDYGLACLVLSKKGLAMNQNGMVFNDSNMDTLLFQRALSSKIRKSGGRIKGPKKRKEEEDIFFETVFRSILEKNA